MTVLVEGGSETLGSFLAAGEIDHVVAFVAPRLLGGRDAPGAMGGHGIEKVSAALSLASVEVERYGGDLLISGRVAPARPGEV